MAASAAGSRPTCRWPGASPATRADPGHRGPAARAPCYNRLLSPPFPSYSRSHDMSDQPVSNGAAAPAQNGPQFSVAKIYVKDVSFEAPGAPAVFNEQAQPQLQMNLNQRVQRPTETAFEDVRGLPLTCPIGADTTASLDEVQQAAVFGWNGFAVAELTRPLGHHSTHRRR